jgi:3-dehydroquinate synthase
MNATAPQALRVETPAAQRRNGYDIHVGAGLLSSAPGLLNQVLPQTKKIVIVTDAAVRGLYGDKVSAAFAAAGFGVAPLIEIAEGERSKALPVYQRITEEILSAKPDRQTAVVALGGGVVGDIAGFAAATVLRGLPFVQMPTTLLAQVDSSVGGKVGINTAQGKNMLGAFYPPALVIADTDVLKTLPARQMLAGYAEIVKAALVRDAAFFCWLEENGRGVLTQKPTVLAEAIIRSCKIKAAIVAEDPLETTGLRALLNLGHTFGHALEHLGGYDGRLLHGEAVAIGLCWAASFSAAQSLLPEPDARRIVDHLKHIGLMQVPPFDWAVADVIDAMRGDKKNADRKMRLIVLEGIGRARAQEYADDGILTTFLRSMKGQL